MRDRGPTSVLLLGALIAVALPVPSAGQDAAPTAPVRVFVPNDNNLQWMNFWVAAGAGYFRDEGLIVEVVAGDADDDEGARGAMQPLMNGTTDVAVLPRPLFLLAVGQQRPVIAFANLLRNDPINLVIHRDVAAQRGLTPDLPLEDRLNGLRGLRVGVAPGPLSRLRVLMFAAGLDADSDIEAVIVPGEAQNDFFAQRRVDALYAHTPFLETALVKQDGLMLVNQSAGEVPELANRQIHMLVTTRQFRSSSPEALRGMTRAVYRAQRLIHADKGAALVAIRGSGVRLRMPEALDTLVEIYEPAIPLTPEVSIEDALHELALFPSRRAAPDLSTLDMSHFIDNTFAAEAVAAK